jgi:hypothetical protein
MDRAAASGSRWGLKRREREAGPRPAWLERVLSAPVLTTATIVGLAAAGGVVGADARWLAALGAFITRHGEIPSGVPFAAASTTHWVNPLVLAELLFHLLESAFSDRGLMLAQLLAVAVAVIVLVRDARAAGATDEGAGAATLLAALGAGSSLVIARVQLFSLVLFPLLAALLRSEARRPSWRIWLTLPLIALWSNLHGAVLTGLVLVGVYLALQRIREQVWTAVAVGLGALVAVCATPAGIATISYYRGLLGNQAAARGQGLWGPLSLTAPLDVLMVIVVLVFAWQCWRRRPRAWELVVAAVLAVATIKAARSGVWLVFFLAVPAAPGFRSLRWWNWVMPPLATFAVVALVIGLVRGPVPAGASDAMLARAMTLAHGSPILAGDIIDEQVVLDGGRISVGNPIDAFSKVDQNAYLDWLAGDRSGRQAMRHVRVVVTGAKSPAGRLMARDPQFRRVQADSRADLYVRVHAPAR